MRTWILTVLAGLSCLAGGARTCRAGLDFTLHRRHLPADGLAVDTPYITDGPSKIYLRLPPEWQVADTSGSIDINAGGAEAHVRLELYADGKPLTIDEAGGRQLLAQAISKLPPDAKGVVPVSVDLNPLPIFGWKTVEASFRYQYFGETLHRSVMYVEMLPERIVQLTVLAPETDFPRIHKQARQILSSWFEPSRDLPPDLQRKYEAPVSGGS